MVLIVLIMLFLRDLLCREFLQKQPVCLWDWRGQWLSGSQGQVLLHLPQVSPYSCVWPPPSYLPIPSPIVPFLLPSPPLPSLSSLPTSLQETTSVQGDIRQTRGAHHCHQDRPRTPWPPLSHWTAQRRGTQLSRICHISWRAGHS